LSIEIGTMTAAKLSVSGLVVSTSAWAQSAISKIDAAINTVSTERARLGAKQNRLEHTIKNLVRDVDMAQEMMNFTKNNILNQAATAMLAQANMVPQGVLQLLG